MIKILLIRDNNIRSEVYTERSSDCRLRVIIGSSTRHVFNTLLIQIFNLFDSHFDPVNIWKV